MRGRSVSPQRTATRSSGTPSSSAAIWARTVCAPLPMSCTLLSTTALAVGAEVHARGTGEAEAAHRAGGHPVPDPPVPVLPRALVAVAPAVAAGALRVGLPQPVARPRPAVRGRHLGEVGQPQVEGVDPGLVGELVHRALQRPEPRPLDGGAHRRRHVERDPLDLQPQPDRGRRVERLARLGGGLHVRLDQPGVVDGGVLDAQQPPRRRRRRAGSSAPSRAGSRPPRTGRPDAGAASPAAPPPGRPRRRAPRAARCSPWRRSRRRCAGRRRARSPRRSRTPC